MTRSKAVILLWMTGGPSHIDTWDPKPEMPSEIRGPFGVIPTKLPACGSVEYLPKMAAMLDRFTLIRSVDCRESNHEPNQVMQTANRAAEPRAEHEGPSLPRHRQYRGEVARAERSGDAALRRVEHEGPVARGLGRLSGAQFDPFNGTNAQNLFALPGGLTMDRLRARRTLVQQMDRVRATSMRPGKWKRWTVSRNRPSRSWRETRRRKHSTCRRSRPRSGSAMAGMIGRGQGVAGPAVGGARRELRHRST
jgi:hypothetical protein